MPDRDGPVHRVEQYFDTVPRATSVVEECGPFTVFESLSPWPYYARPTLGRDPRTSPIRVDDVRSVVALQRRKGLAVAIEWQHELIPELVEVAVTAGLKVRMLPLLVHDPAVRTVLGVDGWECAIVRADDPEIERMRAVAAVGWQQVDTAVGPGGTAERDREPLDRVAADFCRAEMEEGRRSMAIVRSERHGPVAVGTHRPCGDVTEIVGVAVLPAFRRRGLAAALTALLVDDAYARGATTVALSAESDPVVRIYERIGFRRIGTAGVAEAAD